MKQVRDLDIYPTETEEGKGEGYSPGKREQESSPLPSDVSAKPKQIINITADRERVKALRLAALQKANEVKAKAREEEKLAQKTEEELGEAVEKEAQALDKTLAKTNIPETVRQEIISVFFKTGGTAGLLRWINLNKKKGLPFYYKELLLPALKMASDSGKPTGPKVIVNITGLYPDKTMVNITPVAEEQ